MNKCSIKGFTLLELIISILILSIMVIGISSSMIVLSKTIVYSEKNQNILSDINNFLEKCYSFQYSSGIIYNSVDAYNSIILHDYQDNGIIIGIYEKKSNGIYKLSENKIFGNKYLGYFHIDKTILSNIFDNPNYIYYIDYANGEVFPYLIPYDININSFNSGSILEMKLSVFGDYLESYSGSTLQTLEKTKQELFDFTINY